MQRLVFLRRLSHELFEKTGKMRRITKANPVGDLADGFAAIGHAFFGHADHLILDVRLG